MSKPAMVERDLLVFSIWAVLGFGGLALLVEGFSRDSYVISLAATVTIVAGFIAHIVVNAVFDCGFKPGLPQAVLHLALAGARRGNRSPSAGSDLCRHHGPRQVGQREELQIALEGGGGDDAAH